MMSKLSNASDGLVDTPDVVKTGKTRRHETRPEEAVGLTDEQTHKQTSLRLGNLQPSLKNMVFVICVFRDSYRFVVGFL